mmetsp:Transcript_29887/g.66102  ORF Transcript_29887/g.66102 Transcript_29887/m.66102 type:complete len:107 (-) Transcript_29887:169-489(-)
MRMSQCLKGYGHDSTSPAALGPLDADSWRQVALLLNARSLLSLLSSCSGMRAVFHEDWAFIAEWLVQRSSRDVAAAAPLIRAARHNQTEVVRILLHKGHIHVIGTR